MTVMEVTADITGQGSMGMYTGGRNRPTQDEIARLAYELYEMRGRRDGHDVEDWLAAERQLVHHFE